MFSFFGNQKYSTTRFIIDIIISLTLIVISIINKSIWQFAIFFGVFLLEIGEFRYKNYQQKVSNEKEKK